MSLAKWIAPLALALPLAAFADPKRDGKWEVTVAMEMNGMRMPPMTYVSCMTRDNPMPHDPKRANDCKVVEQKVVGNTVHWKSECKSQHGTAQAEGDITYSGDSFTGKMKMTSQTPRGPMAMTHEMTGKRLGDCDK